MQYLFSFFYPLLPVAKELWKQTLFHKSSISHYGENAKWTSKMSVSQCINWTFAVSIKNPNIIISDT